MNKNTIKNIQQNAKVIVSIKSYDLIQPFYQRGNASIYLKLYVTRGYHCNYFSLYLDK